MSNNVIILFGLSGVGKTTFLKRVALLSEFLHLQASDLIKMQFEVEEDSKLSSEQLRRGDINDNQMKLAIAFLNETKEHGGTIVLDGHSIIDAPEKLIKIQPAVLAPVNPTKIVFLKDSAEAIFQRRLNDRSRQRPSRTACELAEQQNIALEQAEAIAGALAVPILVVNSGDWESFASLL